MTSHKLREFLRTGTWHTLALATVLAAPTAALAQAMPPDHAVHHPTTAPADMSLVDQVAELRGKVAGLEMAMHHRQMGMQGRSSGGMQSMPGMGQNTGGSMPGLGQNAGSSMPGMAAGSGAGGMGMMDDKMMGMMGGGRQPTGQMSGGGMSMMKGMMGGEMGGMGSMPKGGMSRMDQGMMGMMGMAPGGSTTGGMAMPTALPGFPGASHLYHIGSSGFFLDHSEHITLTTEQQTALNTIKEKALLDKSDAQRKIDAAEQELWTLTASDQPDAVKIEAKVQETEKLRGEQRLNFIRAVGEAAKVLTDEQRKSLLGQLPPQGQSSQPASGGGMGGGMGDM